jgi:hypothetical protein
MPEKTFFDERQYILLNKNIITSALNHYMQLPRENMLPGSQEQADLYHFLLCILAYACFREEIPAVSRLAPRDIGIYEAIKFDLDDKCQKYNEANKRRSAAMKGNRNAAKDNSVKD